MLYHFYATFPNTYGSCKKQSTTSLEKARKATGSAKALTGTCDAPLWEKSSPAGELYKWDPVAPAVFYKH